MLKKLPLSLILVFLALSQKFQLLNGCVVLFAGQGKLIITRAQLILQFIDRTLELIIVSREVLYELFQGFSLMPRECLEDVLDQFKLQIFEFLLQA